MDYKSFKHEQRRKQIIDENLKYLNTISPKHTTTEEFKRSITYDRNKHVHELRAVKYTVIIN